jgi:UDP-2,4-diacetamido-2,4,6-trideoxy-beta-L-altropyranose hydrolase
MANREIKNQKNSNITLRLAESTDCRRVFEWRNDPEVYRFSFNPFPLQWTEHEQWFRSVIDDPDTILLIAIKNETPCGVIRFDVRQEEGSAEISIYLSPEHQGKGFGATLLHLGETWLKNNKIDVRRLTARVRFDNEASHKIFAKQGFFIQFYQYEKKT